ncbi:hypothetical protein CTA2_1409 [Colletotrichum tanaceti]|uniref:Uncharacterized protein n=1 Tax=Colletotrichum tanaceti TaxID=1306861 RepID=A0A4U6XKV9_9PEZI|nr:hypothetical protein CTA2_1409 [Colletotrichum tanaceti]TKW56235.1 hypothetical protein CTA1_3743 [Colletotrichum tanaceti]
MYRPVRQSETRDNDRRSVRENDFATPHVFCVPLKKMAGRTRPWRPYHGLEWGTDEAHHTACHTTVKDRPILFINSAPAHGCVSFFSSSCFLPFPLSLDHPETTVRKSGFVVRVKNQQSTMLVSSILAVLGASTLAAATSAAPAITPFLSVPDVVPTTLISIKQPASSSPLSSASLASSAPPASPPSSAASEPSASSASSAYPSTVTSRPAVTRTISLRPAKTNSYEACGGLRATPKPCPASFECIDDPFVPGCGLACDRPGICVVPIMCGGIAAIKCPAGKFCVDDPRDDCHPLTGGADCSGLCI